MPGPNGIAGRQERSDLPADPAGEGAELPTNTGWDWLVAHPDILDQYRGEYIAVWGEEVLVHGTDVYVLRDALKASPHWHKSLLIFRVPTREEVDSLIVM